MKWFFSLLLIILGFFSPVSVLALTCRGSGTQDVRTYSCSGSNNNYSCSYSSVTMNNNCAFSGGGVCQRLSAQADSYCDTSVTNQCKWGAGALYSYTTSGCYTCDETSCGNYGSSCYILGVS